MSFTPENIKSRLHEQPFKPLQLVTTTGQTYEVYHPDMIFVTVRYLYVGLPSTPNRVVADDTTRIALMHITELRDLPILVNPATE